MSRHENDVGKPIRSLLVRERDSRKAGDLYGFQSTLALPATYPKQEQVTGPSKRLVACRWRESNRRLVNCQIKAYI